MSVYIIAEAGVNHNGDLNLAFELVDAAKAAGVDCVKFQTFKSENLVSRGAQRRNTRKQRRETAPRRICSSSWSSLLTNLSH